MTKAQKTVLNALFTHGFATCIPGSNEHKAAIALCKLFPLVERETVVGGAVVYIYRINEHACTLALNNFKG